MLASFHKLTGKSIALNSRDVVTVKVDTYSTGYGKVIVSMRNGIDHEFSITLNRDYSVMSQDSRDKHREERISELYHGILDLLTEEEK